ncbi:MAG: DUF1499 domain-containing protein [Pseudomonadota bacterium]
MCASDFPARIFSARLTRTKILVWIALLIGGIGALALGGLVVLGFQSRDMTPEIGIVDGALTPCPDSPNCVSSEPGTPPSHYVDPLSPAVWPQLPGVIDDLGGTRVAQSDGYLYATFSSSIFKFVDDVEFRLAEDAVHVRSASRVGESDMGANADRVAAIKDALK